MRIHGQFLHPTDGKISWKNKKIPLVLAARSSTALKAVAKEPTS